MALIPLPETHLMFLADPNSLQIAYCAADVFVAPSRMEAFGQTLAESMVFDTPFVSFFATGPKDIVDHKITGSKARPFDPADLARGIDWVLDQSPDKYNAMREQCRQMALARLDSGVIARKYLDLYREMLG